MLENILSIIASC